MEDRSLLQNTRQPSKPSRPVLIIFKLLSFGLSVAFLVIGVLYLDKCPRQPLIPVYLIVQGVFALVLLLLSCLPCTQEEENGGGAISTFCTTWKSLVTLFLFCWFLAGNGWVYSIYEPNYDPMTPPYCAKTLYLFTFWIIILGYILLGLALIAGCCVMVCKVPEASREGPDPAGFFTMFGATDTAPVLPVIETPSTLCTFAISPA